MMRVERVAFSVVRHVIELTESLLCMCVRVLVCVRVCAVSEENKLLQAAVANATSTLATREQELKGARVCTPRRAWCVHFVWLC